MSEDKDEQAPETIPAEQREQIERAFEQLGRNVGRVSKVGCLGFLFRGFFGSIFRLPRLRGRKMVALGAGLLIMVLSLVTCSAGVDLQSLTASYGEPVPASLAAATRLMERTGASIQNSAANRTFRISISEVEATSALSLGLMVPELSLAMETLPPGVLRGTDDLAQARRALREYKKQQEANASFQEKVVRWFDPELRTGDVQVRFTGSGEIVIAGYVEAWRWRQPAIVVFAPRARSGELDLRFVSGKLGRLPAPAWAFNALGNLAESLILQRRDYAEISNITVSQGRLTFEARLTR